MAEVISRHPRLVVASIVLGGIVSACKNVSTTARGLGLPASPLIVQPASLRVLILGEGFTDQKEFDTVAATMTTALKDLPGSAANGSSVDVRAKVASAPLGVKQQGNCFFDANSTALTNVRNEKPADFDAQRYLVILKLTFAAKDKGCSYGDVSIVAADAYANTVRHEMGHNLAGLYDEIGSLPNAPSVRSRNCSTSPAYWLQDPPTSFKNCNGYFDLLRPTQSCIMNGPVHSNFCKVCEKHVRCALDGQLGGCPEPPPAAPLPESVLKGQAEGLDVVAVIDRSGGVRVLSADDIQISALRPQVITSDEFAVVRDGERGEEIVGVAPLSMEKADVPDDGGYPLTARAYGPNYEAIVPVDARLIRFTVVGIKRENLNGHHLTLDLGHVANARQKFFLDDATVTQVSVPPLVPPYKLQLALENLLH